MVRQKYLKPVIFLTLTMENIMLKEKESAKIVDVDLLLLKNPFFSSMLEWEQSMMKCWNVVDDLQMVNEKLQSPIIHAIAELYQAKFEHVMDEYSNMIHTAYGIKKEQEAKPAKKATKK